MSGFGSSGSVVNAEIGNLSNIAASVSYTHLRAHETTVYYQVENGHDRDGLGSEENYFWKTAKERTLDVSVGSGGTDMNADFYGGDFKIDLNEPELG